MPVGYSLVLPQATATWGEVQPAWHKMADALWSAQVHRVVHVAKAPEVPSQVLMVRASDESDASDASVMCPISIVPS